MAEASQIVLLGGDPLLLETRQTVLARHFDVTAVTDLAKVTFGHLFELAVLCHTLSDSDYREAASHLRKCCPPVSILALTATEPGRALEDADCRLPGLDGPKALIAAVRSTLRTKPSVVLEASSISENAVLA